MGTSGRWLRSLLTMQGAVAVAAFSLAALAGAGYVPPKAAEASVLGFEPKLESTEADHLDAESALSEKSEVLSKSSLGRVDTRPAFRSPAPLPARPRKVVKRVLRMRTTMRPAPRPVAPQPPAAGWRTAVASWYGPGFYGRRMAGGGTLTVSSMIVAHRTLPFGTRIQFEYVGRTCTAVVMDRGPFIGGRSFDLGPGVARALGFGGVHAVRYRIL